ncbi:MAG: nucleotidyltransferase domain-containing protein [Tannerella sp.]|nr:nucleotidyltransferase domain-containing protein [Tannerella sp.]
MAHYRNDLERVLLKNSAVKRLYLFGSVLTTRFDDQNSDIDVLVETSEIPPDEKGEQLMILWDELENLFARKVDLLTENSLRNPILIKQIEQTRKLIYDGQTNQIFI